MRSEIGECYHCNLEGTGSCARVNLLRASQSGQRANLQVPVQRLLLCVEVPTRDRVRGDSVRVIDMG